jgi:hypothetical protein
VSVLGWVLDTMKRELLIKVPFFCSIVSNPIPMKAKNLFHDFRKDPFAFTQDAMDGAVVGTIFLLLALVALVCRAAYFASLLVGRFFAYVNSLIRKP